jgi:polar amino acid transport system substrate-binding protein
MSRPSRTGRPVPRLAWLGGLLLAVALVVGLVLAATTARTSRSPRAAARPSLAPTAFQARAAKSSTAKMRIAKTRIAQSDAGGAQTTNAQQCDPTASLRPPAGPPRVTAGSDMARIRARGFLIAGVDANTYHFGFLNPLDGQFEGFDIDMLHAVAEAIFGNPDKIEFRAIGDAQRIGSLQSGAVDIVAHTMTINCARLRQVDFSTVYFDAGQRVLVEDNSRARDIGDLGGQKVCASAGSTSIANIAAAPSHPVPVAVPFITDCLVLLQQGDVAAISTDDSVLAGLAAQDPTTRLVGPRLSSEPYGLGISQQHPDLVRFLNAVLAQLRSDGQWAASYAHWIGAPVPAPPAAHYQD